MTDVAVIYISGYWAEDKKNKDSSGGFHYNRRINMDHIFM